MRIAGSLLLLSWWHNVGGARRKTSSYKYVVGGKGWDVPRRWNTASILQTERTIELKGAIVRIQDFNIATE